MDTNYEIIKCLSKICRIPENEFTLDTEIYDSKIISSLQILELMTYIEKHYQIIIHSEELIIENFKNIRTISNFIDKKMPK